MIEAKELRIGNILNSRDKDSDGSIVKVENIHIGGINEFVSQSGYDYEYRFDPTDKYDWFWLEPIPLTAEILLKSGFIKSYDEIFNLTFYDLGNVSICDCEGFTLSGQKMPPIKYVHQLQNLVFILRGEEITINL